MHPLIRWIALCMLFRAVPVLGEIVDSPDAPTTVEVRAFHFQGGEALPQDLLSTAVAPYVGVELGDAGLLAAARAVTTNLVAHGYWNSGAELPDQTITNGVVTLRITQGRMDEIHVHGTEHLRPDWIERRIGVWTSTPLHMDELALGLQLLRENRNIQFVSAEFAPLRSNEMVVPGGGVLDVRVGEARPWRVGIQVDNQRPLNVGEFELLALLADLNVSGHGDSLELTYGILQQKPGGGVEFSGDGNIGVAYTIPVTPRDFRIGGFYDRKNYAVVQPPFNALDIQSSYWGAGLRLSQPILMRAENRVNAGLIFERRHSQGTLLGAPFPFNPGSINGEVNVTALRLTTDWRRDTTNQVIAVQLVASVGLDALDATLLPGLPDGQFFSLLGRVQYGLRLWELGGTDPGHSGQLILRGGFQWTPDPLPAMEQLSMGGFDTVRGYPQNYAVRDTGIMASAELRTSLLEHRAAALSGGPFADFGVGWNPGASTPNPPTLSSVGIAFQALFWSQLTIRVDWGYRFNPYLFTSNDPQYHGVNFIVGWQLP